MFKVKSGPGGPNKEFLAWCHAHGIIIYLGVPKTNAVLQEMDQSYGGFKTGFYGSIFLLVKDHLKTANGYGQTYMGESDYVILVVGRK